ncbi:hypothetical protein [Paludisphaera rhizosphaerae]|uniref:hypothetical protein n=1 Tax=Paludisphaera rhizosphaerae TaxID=2711216 RepID=UPI0013EA3C62|nr:hypothetical protein [Paludisphaera rhizosphaerae]
MHCLSCGAQSAAILCDSCKLLIADYERAATLDQLRGLNRTAVARGYRHVLPAEFFADRPQSDRFLLHASFDDPFGPLQIRLFQGPTGCGDLDLSYEDYLALSRAVTL